MRLATRLGGAAVAAALLFAALIAVSPHFLIGFPLGHSANVNIFWYEPFSEQLFAGELLPRWLFNYWGGLGAPVFYFYAPLPYYLLSVADLMLIGKWGDFAVLSVGHFLLYFLSGVAFYALVRRHVARFWSTAAAIGYMLAPYHYIDLECRAAMGEACAYIWIPLILTGVLNPKKTWRGTILAAMAYAGLLLSHLPSALLAAPAIVLFSILSSEPPERWRAFGHSVAVGVLGVALGAFYVLPAMMLRDTMAYDPWITGQGWHYVATRWLIGSPDLPGFGRQLYAVLGGTSAFGVGSWAVHTVLRKSRFGVALACPPGHLAAAIITVLCSCWFLMSVLSRPLWEYVPFLSQVQFPWRMGVLVDVCSLLLVALFVPPVIERAFAALGFEGRRRRALEGAFCTLALAVLAGLVIDVHFPATVRAKTDIARIPAPVEYRPRWLVESPTYLGARAAQELLDIETAPKAHRQGVARWERRVNRLQPIAALRALRRDESLRIESDEVTRYSISALLDLPAHIRVKKVYYPHWRLIDQAGEELETHPDERTGLLSFELPKGRHELTLERHLLPVEIAGNFVSLFALLGVVIAGARSAHRSRSAR